MEGGQSGTYLRLTRALSGPRVSVAKTYRDETKMLTFIQIIVEFLSSRIEETESKLFSVAGALLFYSTAEECHCDLAVSQHFRFISICLSDAHPRAGRRSRLS